MSAPEQDFDFHASSQPNGIAACENRLIQVRLGIASSLLAALRQKYAPAANHSLRVALGCSSWASAIGVQTGELDELEVASLLHDVGKIGAPDRLLLKPAPLDLEEARLMDRYRVGGLDILSHCCPSQAIVDIIRHSAAWYDGSRPNYPLIAKEIPAGARMLAIVDAFDSMTTDQVYRPALSRERALNELFEKAGTQFDPDMVKSFCELDISAHLHPHKLSQWLTRLDPRKSNQFWQASEPSIVLDPAVSGEGLFHRKLFDNMHDAVVFVDTNLRIVDWNRGAERLTGIPSQSVLHRTWAPGLIGLRDEQKGELRGNDCPVTYCVATGVQSLRRLVARSGDRCITVDVHTVPVVGPDGTKHGAAMLLHDSTPQASLEERCNHLHERATKDPLTQVANRAEFDRMNELFVSAHLECNVACSLIICDIDHFKSINDNYGHPAGDDVLRSFGSLLKSECRSGDVVARYGGEEFVILCANCNNASAARRAEELRRLISQRPQAALNGNVVTVSFGVTEIQPGDTPESLLRRADRALLEAKRVGRNTVVQLGDGLHKRPGSSPATVEGKPSGEVLVDTVLATSVPLTIAVEKLRGFVLDHHAEILGIKNDRIDLQIDAHSNEPNRRRSDRPIPFVVELVFSEQRVPTRGPDGQVTGHVLKTRARVTIRMLRTRDRRTAAVTLQANAILASIQAYLMAQLDVSPAESDAVRRSVSMLAPWLKMRN